MSRIFSDYSSYNGFSMNPTLLAGDGLIIQPYGDGKSMQAGDVIAFPHPEQNYDVVHRIIEVKDGRIRTQGDNNNQIDPYKIDIKDIIGQVVAVKRNDREISIPGGAEGIRYCHRIRRQKRIKDIIAFLFRPIYRALADAGLFYGFADLKVVSFQRPGGVEYQLLRGEHHCGRKKPGIDRWEINFPYRLFVDEQDLYENQGDIYQTGGLFRHLKEISWLEKATLLLFFFTCYELLFPGPKVVLMPEIRVRVYPALLCGLSGLAALLVGGRDLGKYFRRKEICVILLLVLTALISGALSRENPAGMLRALALLTSGLGGFVCARILLNSLMNQQMFKGFCFGSLLVMVLLGFTGMAAIGHVNYFLTWPSNLYHWANWSRVDAYDMSVNLHHWIDVIFLLCCIPLSMIFRKPRQAVCGIVTVFLGYMYLFLTRVRSAILIPICVSMVLLFSNFARRKFMIIALIVMLAGLLGFVIFFPDRVTKLNLQHGSISYRVENYPFSWHIACRHPLTGIGIRSSREKFLADYHPTGIYGQQGKFAVQVKRLVTSENIFLTLLVGLGLPFTLLFMGGIGALMWQLKKYLKTGNGSKIFHPAALFLVLSCCLLHALIYDSFLRLQVSWYFFIFLGLIPINENHPETSPEQ